MSAEDMTWLDSELPASGAAWVKCFDSSIDDASSPATFHAHCDQYVETVSIARNSLGYTFGGYVRFLPTTLPIGPLFFFTMHYMFSH
jgi:hypothetical protein